MIKTFLNELKYIFKNPWRAVAFIVMLFIPFIYGFLYMNAYWAPFKHVDKLNVVVVNQDAGKKESDELTKSMLKDSVYKIGNSPIHVTEVKNIYQNIDEVKEEINDGKWAAAIVIPKDYSTNQKRLIDEITKDESKLINDPIGTISSVYKNIFDTEEKQVQFMNSYKHNYLNGEITNFIAGLSSLSIDALTAGLSSKLGPSKLETIKSAFEDIISKAVKYDNVGGDDINSYGKGLSPYFISIALWAGSLVMVFVIKNNRHKDSEHIGTFKHYFGKTLLWFLSGWLQATILITAVTLQGVNFGIGRQWQLYLMAYLISMIFALIVQAISYMFRYGDLGEFAVVIILVLQLTSSSGTFPVEMQHMIFKVIHPIAPFTYSIDSFRELLYEPNAWDIARNILILLAFPLVLIPFSLLLNWRFDKKTVKWNKNIPTYRSYEIHLGDL